MAEMSEPAEILFEQNISEYDLLPTFRDSDGTQVDDKNSIDESPLLGSSDLSSNGFIFDEGHTTMEPLVLDKSTYVDKSLTEENKTVLRGSESPDLTPKKYASETQQEYTTIQPLVLDDNTHDKSVSKNVFVPTDSESANLSLNGNISDTQQGHTTIEPSMLDNITHDNELSSEKNTIIPSKTGYTTDPNPTLSPDENAFVSEHDSTQSIGRGSKVAKLLNLFNAIDQGLVTYKRSL
jgi:hypothetical protein